MPAMIRAHLIGGPNDGEVVDVPADRFQYLVRRNAEPADYLNVESVYDPDWPRVGCYEPRSSELDDLGCERWHFTGWIR